MILKHQLLQVIVCWLLLDCFILCQDGDSGADEKRPYKFAFNIEGYQHRSEEKDEKGIIMGEYGFITGDGVYHITVYATDENGNFKILRTKNVYIGLPGEPTTPTPAQRAQPLQKKITGPDQMAPATILGKPGCGGCLIPTTATPESRAVISTSSGQLPQKPTGLSSKSPERMNSGSPGNPFSNLPQQQPPTSNQYSVYTQPGVFSGSPGSNSYQKPPQPPPTFLLTPYIDDKNVPSSFTESPIPGLSSSDRPQKPSPGNPQTISQNPVPTPGGEISSGTLAKVPQQQPLPLSDAAFPTLPPDVPVMKISLDISDPKTREFMLKMPELIENVKSREELQALLYTFNYTLTYHGHNEVGNVAGDKNGSYFFNGRDGLGRNVTYVANEFGYQPNITLYDISERETPNEKTEKDLTELLGNEFKWFYGRSKEDNQL
ncbi:Insect cuticle protein [Nesidiocoris tenuis]|uniref:Insect cuticle protein n=1 Tax=Nesidiocoris tenuis TaxID=355587 RepID=A0ABN7ALX1_9HEMI|nr:Insect cuticle protein [Nesidiocoris tenuis]